MYTYNVWLYMLYAIISMQGKGTENVSRYKEATLLYLDIPNIHAVRESFDGLRSLCLSPASDKWFSLLEGTQWLAYVSLILKVLHVRTYACVPVVSSRYMP